MDTSRESRPCTHEHRPGTTVCLYCRREERLAARARFRRHATRIGVRAGALIVVIAGVMAGLSIVRDVAATRVAGTTAVASGVTANDDARDADAVATLQAEASDPPPVVRPREAPPFRPIVAEGTTHLPDSLYAVRSGGYVTVVFDTEMGRTRRPEKFERIVRATLPEIYGQQVESVLTTIPDGYIARRGDLLTELPERGVEFPLGDGWMMRLWPVTRPGRDGPLVTQYRVTLAQES